MAFSAAHWCSVVKFIICGTGLTYHSDLMLSSLAEKRTHRVQTPLTYLQIPDNHSTSICIGLISSRFNLIAALALHFLSLTSLGHQQHRYVSGINSLVLSVNLIPVFLSVTCVLLLLTHLLTLSTHHPYHPQFIYSFISGAKRTSFTYLSHHKLSSGLRTDSMDFITETFLLSIFFLFKKSFLHYSSCFWFRAAD